MNRTATRAMPVTGGAVAGGEDIHRFRDVFAQPGAP